VVGISSRSTNPTMSTAFVVLILILAMSSGSTMAQRSGSYW